MRRSWWAAEAFNDVLRLLFSHIYTVLEHYQTRSLTQNQTNRLNQKFLNNEWQVVNIPLDRRANQAHGVNRLVYRPNNKNSLIVAYP
jgi:hypothetical protein